ncbi:MAG: glutathione synthase, partial [Alphaproteobacteria bacterium]|nr:glutathione synthase [Alphaproteobacteria bacterium]
MELAVAIQMDPIGGIDIDADSTFALALEAQRRGHGLTHYLVQDLTLRDGKVTAQARTMEVRRDAAEPARMGAAARIDLADMDVLLMRQDPPFDMAYITATHLLEHIHPDTLVVNDPVAVRNAPEKLFVTHFADFMPPTVITRDAAEIADF